MDTGKLLIGKWKECAKAPVQDTVIKIDSGYSCKGSWTFEFKKDGTYLENYFEECGGKRYQGDGKWKWQDGSLLMQSVFHCSDGYAFPESKKVIWLNKNKWLYIGREPKNRLVYIYYERVR